MGSNVGYRRAVSVAGLVLLVTGACWTAPVGAVSKKGTAVPAEARLAQGGHAAFWDCPARTTEMLVAVNTLTLRPGVPLDISFSVHNAGTSSCTYTAPFAGQIPGPTATTLTAGPCGSVTYEVEDAHHHDVWPGAQVVNCPALGMADLAPGAFVSGRGAWSQTGSGSLHRVAPGSYFLVVGSGHFTFPLRVTRS
jgi:hypothetical protein